MTPCGDLGLGKHRLLMAYLLDETKPLPKAMLSSYCWDCVAFPRELFCMMSFILLKHLSHLPGGNELISQLQYLPFKPILYKISHNTRVYYCWGLFFYSIIALCISVRERRNSISNALALRLSFTNPSILLRTVEAHHSRLLRCPGAMFHVPIK